jgi:NADH:ubiquinone reductase (H+-translocating)
MKTHKQQKVLILGGGFVGIKTALELYKSGPEKYDITVISSKPNFEYHGALYRIATGYNVQEVCLPLEEIFAGKRITVVQDTVKRILPKSNEVECVHTGKHSYDTVVIGLGSQISCFGICGMEEHAFGMKTIEDALQLKHHLHSVLDDVQHGTLDQKRAACNIVVAGAGATGVEVAGDILHYMKELCKQRSIDENLVNVHLIEAMPKVLPAFSQRFSNRIAKRLRSLGVIIRTGCPVTNVTATSIELPDETLQTKTVIWTAGVCANHLIGEAGLPVDKRGRALVNRKLQVEGYENMYAAGDAASTPKSGMAQIALYDAKHIAHMIDRKGRSSKQYKPNNPIYAIPAGYNWAGVQIGALRVYGTLGWVLRRVVDFVVYASFYPALKAFGMMRRSYPVHYCDVCLQMQKCER